MNHLECPCGAEFWTIHALREHFEQAHGVRGMVYQDLPRLTQADEVRRAKMILYYYKKGRRLAGKWAS